jgi:hypothetical protein
MNIEIEGYIKLILNRKIKSKGTAKIYLQHFGSISFQIQTEIIQYQNECLSVFKKEEIFRVSGYM